MGEINNSKQENYFSLNIEKYGDNFLATRPVSDIQRDARKKIFKDMIYGNIDYGIYGKYFQDITFLDNLIVQANSLAMRNQIIATALYNYQLTVYSDPTIRQIYQQYFNIYQIYAIISKYLSWVKYYGNIQCLTQLPYEVYPYRNDYSDLF